MSHTPRFPTAPAQYDANNEAQFRAAVMRAVQGATQFDYENFTAITDAYTAAIAAEPAGRFSHDIGFAATDYRTVTWAGGDIVLEDGSSYTLASGTTGAMAATTYIYLDTDVSTTVLQTTTSASSSVGLNKFLIAVASINGEITKYATFVVFGGGDGRISTFIGANNIATGTITANEIAAGTITANEIASNTITAGEIASGTITAAQIAIGTITGDRLDPSIITVDELADGAFVPPFTHNLAFSASDSDTVAWGTGTITLSDGTSYGSIVAGNTGNMVAPTYVYFDPDTSTTVLQTTTSASTAVGANKWLIAVCDNNADSGKDALFIVYGGGAGNIGTFIGANNIATGTITANEIAANTITASEIAGGTITATQIALGTITGDRLDSGIITVDELAAGTIVPPFTHNLAFSASDSDTVAWGTGTITLSDGTSYGSIVAGNTGNMVAPTYVYFDPNTSTTVLQTTTSASAAVGDEKWLIAVCDNNADSGKDALFIVYGGGAGNIGTYIGANNIATGTITANEIAANTITGSEISALNITGKTITADTGTIGGWTLSANDFSSGSVSLNASTERLLMGAAVAPSSGVGIFLGKDGTDYEFRAGDPGGDYIHWDGSTLTITGNISAGSVLPWTGGDGIDITGNTVSLDIDGLTDIDASLESTKDAIGTDQIVFSRGAALYKDTFNTINLSIFNDDLGYTTYSGGDGIAVSGGAVISVDGVSGGSGLFATSWDYATEPTGSDALIFGDGGLTGTASTVLFNQIDVGIFNDDGTYSVTGHTHPPSDIVAGGTFGAGDYVFPDVLTIEDRLVVKGAGPHSFGTTVATNIQILQSGGFTAVGGSSASAYRINTRLTGNSGNTSRLTLWDIGSVAGITTPAAAITVTDVASMYLDEPNITLGAGSAVTNASTLKIAAAPTEGTNNYALWVASGLSRFQGDLQASNDLYVDAGLSLQNESSTPTVPPGYHTLYSYNNGSSFEIRANDGTLDRNIPLVTGAAANDELLVSTGTDHEADWSGSGLQWNGTTLTATNFSGNGSGLTYVNADNFDVTNLTTEVSTYYPMFTDGVGTGVSGFVNSTDLRWKNTATANQLLLANGAEATPILAFINDEDTGIFGNTAEVSVATGGTERFRVTNGSVQSYGAFFVVRPTGTSVMARFRREDNTNLAWDQRIDTGGTLEFRAISDVGTTLLNAFQLEHATGDLTLKGWIRSENGALGAPTYSFSSDNDSGMWLNGTGTLAFSCAGVNRFQIDESGATTARAEFNATQVFNTEGARITTSGNVTLDWDKYNQVDITNDGTARIVTIDDNSMQDGGHYVLVVDYTSGNITSWTWDATGTLQWQEGSEPTLPTATAGDRTVITFVKTGGITLGFYADAPA